MSCLLLTIDHGNAIEFQEMDKISKRDLGCIGFTGEHRLAVKHTPNRNAVSAADPLVVSP